MATRQTDRSGADGPRRRSSIWRRILKGCGILLGVLLLLGLIGVFLAFSGYRDYSAPRLDDRHYQLLRRFASELRNNRRKQEARIVFSPEEVQYFLDVVRHMSQLVPDRRQVPPAESFL